MSNKLRHESSLKHKNYIKDINLEILLETQQKLNELTNIVNNVIKKNNITSKRQTKLILPEKNYKINNMSLQLNNIKKWEKDIFDE
jgi:hypothetical protein